MKPHASNPRAQREARQQHAKLEREERATLKRQRHDRGGGSSGEPDGPSMPAILAVAVVAAEQLRGGRDAPPVTPRPHDLPDEYTEQMVYAVMRERDRLAALQPEDVARWIEGEDGRLYDVMGLWVQGKRSTSWVAQVLLTEGWIARLIAP